MSPRQIQVVIDSLILDGFDPLSRAAIVTELTADLTTLLQSGGQPAPQPAAQPHATSAGTRSVGVGAQIASAIHSEIAKSGSTP